jgi:putative heme-binding domain-containing protein
MPALALVLVCVSASVWAAEPARSDPLARIADSQPSPPRVPFENSRFLLRTNDVVVFTGPASVVFEQQQGWLEALLAVAAKHEQPRFRYMGWEGDTVFEQARDLNWGGWKENLDAVGASVVVAWFGQIEALDDTHSVDEFAAAYGKLLDEFRKATPRLVVLAPPPFEKPASPWIPDNTSRNDLVKVHAEAARRLAIERGAVFVDAFTPLATRETNAVRLTGNGLHFSPEGQRVVAELIAHELDLDPMASASSALEPVRAEIIRKNRFWFDCWRTMNWAFPYGDRTEQPFSKAVADKPSFAQELEAFRPLIRNADERIQALALGRTPPPLLDSIRNQLDVDAQVGHLRSGTPTQAPEDELQSFRLREGYTVNLFASERDGLIKPLQIRWDERGRLWAACTPSYPQIVPGAPATDFILVCEDTDGDGRADKFRRFAEGLTMPMGMEFVDGGLYVCEGTQLVSLRDTDGDGRADTRRVVASGFGTGDSHQLINSLRWGPDGRLWFTQGLHIMSRVETPWGLARLDRAGIWRMNPRTLQMHGFFGGAAAGANCWGVVFDNWGQVFHLAVDNVMGFYSVPGLIPLAQPDSYYNVGPLAVSKAKGMELEIIGTRHFPDDLQGALVKSVYYTGVVQLYRLRDDGSGFVTDDLGPLISSTNASFRPLESKIGPDGAMYVCDWFNPIIGHYQASYRDPRRDKVHGRVWRITAKDRPLVKAPPLSEMTAAQLLDQLRSPERWVREQAKQVLYNRAASEVIPAAETWLDQVASNDANATNSASLLYEIIGVYAAHEEIRPAVLKRLLDSTEPRLRAFGTRIVGLWSDRLPDSLANLRKSIADDSPRVRLETVVAASYVRSAAAANIVTQSTAQPRDRFLDYAIAQSLRVLKPYWLPALTNGTLELANDPARLELLVKADGTPDTLHALRDFVFTGAHPKPTLIQRETMLKPLAEIGDSNDLTRLLQTNAFIFDREYDVAQHARVLAAVEIASRVRNVRPSGDAGATLAALWQTNADPRLRSAVLRLAALWKVNALSFQALFAAACTPDDDELRITGATTFAVLRGTNASGDLAELSRRGRIIGERVAAAIGFAMFDLPRAASIAADVLSSDVEDSSVTNLLSTFLIRKGGANALGAAFRVTPPARDSARLALRYLNAAGRQDAGLTTALKQAAGLGGEAVRMTAEQIQQLVQEVQTRGDGARGAQIFHRADLGCVACHSVAGAGGNTGPNLDGVGSGQPLDFIIGAVLEPNKEVKEGFEAIEVATRNGETYQGYRIRSDKNELVVRDVALNKEVRLRRDQIVDQQNRGSLMPAGLVDHLTRQELRDLFRYLSELGKGK